MTFETTDVTLLFFIVLEFSEVTTSKMSHNPLLDLSYELCEDIEIIQTKNIQWKILTLQIMMKQSKSVVLHFAVV